MHHPKMRKGYLGFLEAMFEHDPNTITSDPVTEFPAFLERCRVTTLAAMDNLALRYADAMKRYYGLGCESDTLKKVGDSLNVGPERVRQIVRKGLRTLRGSTAFDQLAQELHARGHTSHPLLVASRSMNSSNVSHHSDSDSGCNTDKGKWGRKETCALFMYLLNSFC